MDKRILIVDDCAPIRGLLRAVIEARPGLEVCGEAADGAEGVDKGKDLRPDLIVLDLSMPHMNGLQAAAGLHQILPDAPIISFTLHKNAVSSRQARDAGIASIVSKTEQLGTLVAEVCRLTA
jgi:two-component system response regulator NreC